VTEVWGRLAVTTLELDLVHISVKDPTTNGLCNDSVNAVR